MRGHQIQGKISEIIVAIRLPGLVLDPGRVQRRDSTAWKIVGLSSEYNSYPTHLRRALLTADRTLYGMEHWADSPTSAAAMVVKDCIGAKWKGAVPAEKIPSEAS